MIQWLRNLFQKKQPPKEKKMSDIASVFDVANFYLAKSSMTPKKLQKICYYAYAWTIAILNDSPNDIHIRLCKERFQAWVHGPVNRELYKKYRAYGSEKIEKYSGDKYPFNEALTDVMNQVWKTYRQFTADELETISHRESPWMNARGDCAPYEGCTRFLSDKDIFQYYAPKLVYD